MVDRTSSLPLDHLSEFDRGRLHVADRSIALPVLASATQTHFLADNATIDTVALTALTGGGIELRSAGAINPSVLVNVDGTSIDVSDGIVLSLPRRDELPARINGQQSDSHFGRIRRWQ